jgi:hypothetical protein
MDSHYLNFFICPNYLVKLNSNKICLCWRGGGSFRLSVFPPSTSGRGSTKSRGPVVCGPQQLPLSTASTWHPRPCERRTARRSPCWRTETANRRGGSEWEPIKILLEGDWDSNKMNTASNTRLRLNYPCWSRPRSHWSATDPRNQPTTFRTKNTPTRTAETCTAYCLCHTS